MDLDAWKKKRSRTIKTYLLFKTCVSIDTMLISITIIPYLQERVSGADANYFYSLESTVGYVTSAVVSILIGRIVDSTRHVKYSLYFVLTCGAIGELLYTFRSSPYLVVAARTLCGALPAQDYVLRGEIVRCFEEEEASKVLWWYTTAATFGYTIGSLINLTYNGVHFHIGTWMINSNNFAGVMLLGLFMINMVTVYFFAHDCSKEYDLKSFTDRDKQSLQNRSVYTNNFIDDESTMKSYTNVSNPTAYVISDIDTETFNPSIGCGSTFNTTVVDDIIVGKKTKVDHPIENNEKTLGANASSSDSIFRVLLGFIRSPDIFYVMTSTFLYAGVAFTTDLMSPIIILETFRWDARYLSIQQGLSSIVMALTSLLLAKYGVTNTHIYNASLVTILLSFVSIILLIVITLVPTTLIWQIILLVLYSVATVPLWFLDLSLLPNMLGRMVKTDVQSFAESCRSVFSLSSVIIVGIFFAADGYVKYLFFGLTGLSAFSISIFMYTRRRFIDIKLVTLEKDI